MVIITSFEIQVWLVAIAYNRLTEARVSEAYLANASVTRDKTLEGYIQNYLFIPIKILVPYLLKND